MTGLTTAATGPGAIKTVCYRCRFADMARSSLTCPRCGFPMIMQLGREHRTRRLRSIFDRTSVERVGVAAGAPPLPGVDAQPRQAQQAAEERRRRMPAQAASACAGASRAAATTRSALAARALGADARRDRSWRASHLWYRRRRRSARLAVVLLSVMIAGALAAAIIAAL